MGKKKHQDAIQEMTEQIDQLTKMKSKIEKDKTKIQAEIVDGRAATDEIGRAKASSENADLLRVAGDIANNVNMLQKMKLSLVAALEDAKHVADNEARERSLLLGRFKNLEHELDGMKEQFEEELASREDINRLTSKAEAEGTMWRSKYENEAVAKAEDLEMTKMKLQARLTEADTAIENLNAKLSQIEKAKAKIHGEVEEMNINLDQAQ